MDDWYNVSKEDIVKNGGNKLLAGYYNDSPSKALHSVYPEHNWILWKFKGVPPGYWGKAGSHKLFFDWLYKALGYKCMDDWYNVTKEDITKNGGGGLLTVCYGGSPSRA